MGMKKEFPTYIDETAMLFDAIAVSGGMRDVYKRQDLHFPAICIMVRVLWKN